MVLALARPEVVDQFPDLWSERRVQHLRLPELTRAPRGGFVLDVLGEGVGETTAEALAKRAGGNTFYLEELIRAVAEDRGGALPETVLAMAPARLEQLEPDARRILRARVGVRRGVLVGGVATPIDADRGETLDRARRARASGVRRQGPDVALPRADEFVFRHALVREAAYGMLIERDQQQAHQLASAWLEAAGERDAIVMAEHLERGGEPAGAVVSVPLGRRAGARGQRLPHGDRAREAPDRLRRVRVPPSESSCCSRPRPSAGAPRAGGTPIWRSTRSPCSPRGRARTRGPQRRLAMASERAARRSRRACSARVEPRGGRGRVPDARRRARGRDRAHRHRALRRRSRRLGRPSGGDRRAIGARLRGR